MISVGIHFCGKKKSQVIHEPGLMYHRSQISSSLGSRQGLESMNEKDEILHQKEAPSFPFEISSIMQDSHIDEPNASKSKIFEVVTTFTVPEGINVIRRQSGEVDLQDLAFKTRSTGIVSLYIFSQAIINALRSVVDYYPSVDLSREPIVINAPYAVLVHHEEELAQFSLKCSKLPQERLCAREKDAVEHLGLLRKYLEGTIMPDVVAERVRNKRGFQTYEMMWLRHRPGALILSGWAGAGEEWRGRMAGT